MLKNLLVLAVVAVCSFSRAQAQVTAASTTSVDWFNNASTLLRDQNGTPLSQGSPTLNTDGALVQLGYYNAATTANNFAGTWVPLTGAVSASQTSIGDSTDLTGIGAGRIGFTTVFRGLTNVVEVFDPGLDAGFYTTTSSVVISATTPPAGQILSIRFYNTANAAAGFYNAVSSDAWTWLVPTDSGSGVLLNLTTATLEFQDAANPFLTTIAIPEPTSVTLCVVGAIGGVALAYRRRRLAQA